MSWKNELKNNICSVNDLKKHVKITAKEGKKLQKVIELHPMRITKYYLSLIDKKDKRDPIKKMIVPSEEELNTEGTYDTSGEKSNTKSVGLQHKYKQTAVILCTNRCAAYCRFCFRKRLVGLPSKEILERFNKAIEYIKKHDEINNVLVTGGDPFILPTEMIEKFLQKLSKIKHLDFIRFGTRVPVAFPDRILLDKELAPMLKKYCGRKRIYVVTHFNHPREITKKAIAAAKKLREADIIINNQTVLMRGVNDNPKVLAELQNSLAKIGVNPYYLFQCRPVKRVKNHFQVSFREAYKIVEDAKKMLNGPSKRFRYVMSHKTGKIEIIGIKGNKIYFKYHQAKKPENLGRLFERKLRKNSAWLNDCQKM